MTAAENESSAVVTLRDTGIGMTEEEMKHIFDKCYQADSSHSGEGNGLGLSIAQSLADCMNADFALSIDGDLFRASVSLKKYAE